MPFPLEDSRSSVLLFVPLLRRLLAANLLCQAEAEDAPALAAFSGEDRPPVIMRHAPLLTTTRRSWSWGFGWSCSCAYLPSPSWRHDASIEQRTRKKVAATAFCKQSKPGKKSGIKSEKISQRERERKIAKSAHVSGGLRPTPIPALLMSWLRVFNGRTNEFIKHFYTISL